MSEKRIIQVGHSPDPDDAFMFYAIANGLMDTGDLVIQDILMDIQTLNEWAKDAKLEATALSLFGYGHVSDKYTILPYGSSVGRQYGPMIIAREPIRLDDLAAMKIAVPGELTTAFLTLNILLGKFDYAVVPFQEIMTRVRDGAFDAGLIIHEGQLTYPDFGLHKIIDLGEWWHTKTGLPLPLGVNTVRNDLGTDLMKRVGRILKESIDYSMAHRLAAMQHALNYADQMDIRLADKFVGMYVNEDSMELNQETRRAIDILFQKGKELGLLPPQSHPHVLEF